jgi:hypothetical protein
MSELTAEQAKAGKEYGLPDVLASRLNGQGYEAVAADARSMAEALRAQAEADVPDHVKLARAAIAAAASNPNVAEIQALSRTKPGHQELVDALYPAEGGDQ